MATIRVASLDDPRLAMYRNLKATNATRGRGEFVVEGEKLFDRLIASRFGVASVLTTDRLVEGVAARTPGDAPVYVVEEGLLDVLVGFNFHRGVLACGVRRPWPNALEIAKATGERGTLIVCPRIDNPENLGAIARIADVFGVDAILAGDRCPDPLSRRVLRVSMGSSLRVPIVECDDLAGELEAVRREAGFEALATVTDPGAWPVGDRPRSGRVAILLGSEGHGLGPEWAGRCDRAVTIPMRSGAESLNVAVAAGIVVARLMEPGRGDETP